jgi:hypothetical protein
MSMNNIVWSKKSYCWSQKVKMMKNMRIYFVGMLMAILLGYVTGCSKGEDQDGIDINGQGPMPDGDYYVAPWGNDTNSGSFEKPWATWQKAVTVAVPGDIIYIRNGVYKPSKFAYPGETPILDGSLLSPKDGWIQGMTIEYAQFLHFKGLTVRNMHQEGSGSQAMGIAAASCANLTFENITVHDIDGRGFNYWGGAWNEWDGADAPYKYDTTRWINCDAYNLCDALSSNPGNAADGWKCHNYQNNVLYWYGCRAWNYSDDGFDPSGSGVRIFDHCWAMSTDKYVEFGMEGNGFKTSATWASLWPDPPKENLVVTKNCIAAFCEGVGFYNGLEGDIYNNALYLNNASYRNYIGFESLNKQPYARTDAYFNNIAFGSTSKQDAMDPVYEVAIYRPSIYTESNNTWKATMKSDDWPGWEDSDSLNITIDDFMSVDPSELISPRQADGSLPEIKFLKPAKGSDLIDAGVDVGLSYKGSKPDIGAFEYDE